MQTVHVYSQYLFRQRGRVYKRCKQMRLFSDAFQGLYMLCLLHDNKKYGYLNVHKL